MCFKEVYEDKKTDEGERKLVTRGRGVRKVGGCTRPYVLAQHVAAEGQHELAHGHGAEAEARGGDGGLGVAAQV